ncbi:MAG: hypothetical protein J2P21_32630 [Chloracidobacterium sp.]|nr:hypothetical protein [Chloracidobacterium sp.]
MRQDNEKLRCSFCGSGKNGVKIIIVGPSVGICNICLEFVTAKWRSFSLAFCRSRLNEPDGTCSSSEE